MRLIIGVDEAGRGAWAGPLVAAAVCLKTGKEFQHKLLRDSKELSPFQRQEVFAYLQIICKIGLGIVTVKEINKLGLQPANVLAVERAIAHLRSHQPEVDGRGKLVSYKPQTRLLRRRVKRDILANSHTIVIDYIGGFGRYTKLPNNYSLHKFGESKFPEIAAASIVAKVTRDRIMMSLARRRSQYGFERHKGYGTRQHREALARQGISRAHRIFFAPVQLYSKQTPHRA